jgi:hypothetical protein
MVDGYDGFLVHRIDAEKQEYGTRFGRSTSIRHQILL